MKLWDYLHGFSYGAMAVGSVCVMHQVDLAGRLVQEHLRAKAIEHKHQLLMKEGFMNHREGIANHEVTEI